MPTPRLKPFPFCGGEAELTQEWGLCVVRCKSCIGRCTGGDFDADEDVVAAWNRRAGDQPKQRRDRRKCVHFRFPSDEIAHVWCAKYGPHYDCLGSHGCPNYREGDQPCQP